MEILENNALHNYKKIAFCASIKVASLSVLPTLDWAAEVAKRDDIAVVSGFHS